MDMPTLKISNSEIQKFYAQRERESGLRLGQQFFVYFGLDKITSIANYVAMNRIYEADGAEAKKLIEAVTDWEN